ncbi:hypothetical protein [Ornithinimicrobium cavernae]|uniref:hypothetical protein n=1 Tax=Ornithinimicrobium cavernae TaxID=2666047 RepID=UPI000D6964D4|nr:hypothetical protein [Ornithinimicrobium cavernae]
MESALLLPSPLLPVSAYGGLAASLVQAGADVTVASVTSGEAADARTLVRTWAALAGPGATLIAHSNAGYLAPAVRDLAGRGGRVIFMDAALPPESGPTLLAPSQFRDHISSLASDDGQLPPWTRWWSLEDLDGVIPADRFDELDRDCPRLPVSYFDAQIVAPQGWVDAPNAYLAFGSTYAEELAFAQKSGWPYTVVAGGHLHFLFDPATVAADVLKLTERLSRA